MASQRMRLQYLIHRVPDLNGRVVVADRSFNAIARLGESSSLWQDPGWPAIPPGECRPAVSCRLMRYTRTAKAHLCRGMGAGGTDYEVVQQG